MRTNPVLNIVKLPHEVLRKKAEHVEPQEICSDTTQKLIGNMKRTLAATPDGVGLAAPQVGESLRIFIVSEEAEEIDKSHKADWGKRKENSPKLKNDKPYEEREWKYYVFINPEMIKNSRTRLDGPEGCLSVPGKYGNVKRFEKITIRAYDEHGKKFTRGYSRFFARVIQHELDHINGTIFIDKVEGKLLEAR